MKFYHFEFLTILIHGLALNLCNKRTAGHDYPKKVCLFFALNRLNHSFCPGFFFNSLILRTITSLLLQGFNTYSSKTLKHNYPKCPSINGHIKLFTLCCAIYIRVYYIYIYIYIYYKKVKIGKHKILLLHVCLFKYASCKTQRNPKV